MQLLVAPNFGKLMKSSSKLLMLSICLLTSLIYYLEMKSTDGGNLTEQVTPAHQTSQNDLPLHEASKALDGEQKDTDAKKFSNEIRSSNSAPMNPSAPAKSIEDLISSFQKEQAELNSKARVNPFAPVSD